MAQKPLTDAQLRVIEELVTSDKSVVEICETVKVSRTAFYQWRKDNKLFNDTLQELID